MQREYDRQRGCYTSQVTYLEMCTPPETIRSHCDIPGAAVALWETPEVNEYLPLFLRVGAPWLWFGRLQSGRDEIARIISSPHYEMLRLDFKREPAGFCELDRSRTGEVEIVYFGIVPELSARGLGSMLMQHALQAAWRPETCRVWLHTCSEDHPRALHFYRRMGFEPYRQETEWVHDPRLRGLLPREAGPHVPLAE